MKKSLNFKNFTVKKLYPFHRFAGVFIAFHFTIFALTGLPLLFQSEIENYEAASDTLSSLVSPDAYEVILNHALSQNPTAKPLAIFPDEHHPDLVQLRLGAHGTKEFRGAIKLSYDRNTQAEVQTPPKESGGFFGFMLTLHRELFLGSFGKLYVGFVGLIYVLLLISGFVIYGNFMRGRRMGEIKASTRAQRFRNFHRFAGMITFGWGLVVGISGVFLAFNSVLLKFYQYQSLHQLSAQYGDAQPTTPPARLSDVLKAVNEVRSQSLISYVAFPATEYSIPNHYLVLINGNDAISSRISEIAVVRADTAEVTQILALPLYLKLAMLSEPLHFGNYGGLPLKILWAAFTLLSLAVMGLGVASFFLRRKKSAILPSNPKPLIAHHGRKYPIPLLITALTLIGIIASLFQKGWNAKLSVSLIALPLLVFVAVLGWRKRNV